MVYRTRYPFDEGEIDEDRQKIGDDSCNVVMKQFEFSTPSLEWLVQHNFETTDFTYQIQDENNSMIIADLEVLDENQVIVYFTEAVSGKLVLSFFEDE